MKFLSYLLILVFTSSLYAQDANENYESCLDVVENYSESQMVSFNLEKINLACSEINNSGSLRCISRTMNQSLSSNVSMDLFSVISNCARNSGYRIDRFGPRG